MQQTIYVHGSAALEPDAADHLVHLAEAGHRLVLVAEEDHAAAGLATWTDRATAIPDDPPRGSWFLTTDPAACGDRRPGVRTVLIGPREDGPRTTRCDATARDVRDAMLEILAADAMS
jgi:hypothetical protein